MSESSGNFDKIQSSFYGTCNVTVDYILKACLNGIYVPTDSMSGESSMTPLTFRVGFDCTTTNYEVALKIIVVKPFPCATVYVQFPCYPEVDKNSSGSRYDLSDTMKKKMCIEALKCVHATLNAAKIPDDLVKLKSVFKKLWWKDPCLEVISIPSLALLASVQATQNDWQTVILTKLYAKIQTLTAEQMLTSDDITLKQLTKVFHDKFNNP